MISSEVQRTLVKSPPELWAELSDQTALGRHLGELGEIRITRIDPEQAVEWETENMSGTVQLKPSGWGTKVTLTLTGEIPAPEARDAPESPADGEPAVHAEPENTVQAEFESTMHAAFEPATHVEPEPVAQAQSEPAIHVEPEPLAYPEPEPPPALEIHYQQAVATEPAEAFDPQPALATRRSFFSRLFGSRRKQEAVESEPYGSIAAAEEPPWPPESTESFTVIEQGLEQAEGLEDPHLSFEQAPEAVEIDVPVEMEEPVEMKAPIGADEPLESLAGEPESLSEELRAGEQAATEQAAAVLTAVLDRLGAAHHRPFSRA
jgi:hypothetical protein